MKLWPKWLGWGPSAQDRYVDDWLKGIERGLATATGIRVTVQDALTVPGISACIQVQSITAMVCRSPSRSPRAMSA